MTTLQYEKCSKVSNSMLAGYKPLSLVVGVPMITITSNGVLFNKPCVLKMGKPSYINLLINEVEKRIAIKKCSNSDENAIQFFSENKKSVNSRINSKDLIETLIKLMDWDKNSTYKTVGKYSEEDSAMIFELKQAAKK